MPLIPAQSCPSATSLMVKSNSLRATKSSAVVALRLFSGSTATFAPMKPILHVGLGQPCWIPERSHLSLHLVARASSAIIPVEGGRLQEESSHHDFVP